MQPLPPTESQLKYLQFIYDFNEANGFYPSSVVIAKHFGYSTQAVLDMRGKLKLKNWLVKTEKGINSLTEKSLLFVKR